MVVLVGVEEVGGEGSARLAARFKIETLRDLVHQGAEKTDASLALRDFYGEVALFEPRKAARVGLLVGEGDLFFTRRLAAQGGLFRGPEVLPILVVLRHAVPKVPVSSRCLHPVVADVPGVGVEGGAIGEDGRAAIRSAAHPAAVHEAKDSLRDGVDELGLFLKPAHRFSDIDHPVQENRSVGKIVPFRPVTVVGEVFPDPLDPGARFLRLRGVGKELEGHCDAACVSIRVIVGALCPLREVEEATAHALVNDSPEALLLVRGQHLLSGKFLVDAHARGPAPAAVIPAAVIVADQGCPVRELAFRLAARGGGDEVDEHEIALALCLQLGMPVKDERAEDRLEDEEFVLVPASAVDVAGAQAVPCPPAA